MLFLIILPSVLFLAVLSLSLLICLKIKSSKKDPALVGTPGTISALGDVRTAREEVPPPPLFSTPVPSPYSSKSRNKSLESASANHNVSSSSNRTPSRTGERKLPDIPKDDGLYATLDGCDSDDNVTSGSGVASQHQGPSLGKEHHPYAKVKKSQKSKVEHPYATVKKTAAPSKDNSDPTKELSYLSSSSSSDEENTNLLQGPGRGSRTGSGRSSRHLEASSSHSVHSRQATPLPPEPSVMQNPNMHFSGDSVDSSKGYTSITVREPVRHIHLQRPAAQESTYATVSETSDDMYAAIEDPTYVPTGAASQSNSDTYAVIDLPEEVEVSNHPYSRVDKSKKRAGSMQPPPPATDHRHSYNVEDMYAKVQKRSSMEPMIDDYDLDLPVGASAMHSSLDLGARPRLRQSAWENMAAESKRRHSKNEVNYSEFELNRVDRDHDEATRKEDRESGYELLLPDSNWEKQRFDSSNGGYETVPVPEAFDRDPFDRDPNYEHLPDDWRSTNSGGYETVRERLKDPDYEVLQNGDARVRLDEDYDSLDRKAYKDPGYESVDKPKEPPYAKLMNSNDNDDSELGYETIPGIASSSNYRHHRHEYDPGYEILARPSVSEPAYETVEGYKAHNHQQAMIHMSVHHEPIATDTPVNHHPRRSSVVVIERMEVSGVDELSGNEDDDVNTHIFV